MQIFDNNILSNKRRELGWSLDKLTAKIMAVDPGGNGLAKSTCDTVLRGVSRPSTHTLSLICAALKVRVEECFYDTK